MDIENELLKLYNEFMKANSAFADNLLIVPKTPQSFLKFPTIVFIESSNIDDIRGKSLNRQEYMDRITYTVEIYSKDIVVGNTKYASKVVLKELINLTNKFFNYVGLNRISSNREEFIDLTIDRHISIFEGKINNWNGQII
jgi:hypothetical protein